MREGEGAGSIPLPGSGKGSEKAVHSLGCAISCNYKLMSLSYFPVYFLLSLSEYHLNVARIPRWPWPWRKKGRMGFGAEDQYTTRTPPLRSSPLSLSLSHPAFTKVGFVGARGKGTGGPSSAPHVILRHPPITQSPGAAAMPSVAPELVHATSISFLRDLATSVVVTWYLYLDILIVFTDFMIVVLKDLQFDHTRIYSIVSCVDIGDKSVL